MRIDPATFASDVREIKSEQYRFLRTRHGVGQRVEPHSHERATVTFVASGEFTEVLNAETHRLSRLDMVFKPASVVHANDYPNGAECFVVEFTESSKSFLRESDIDLRDDTWVGSGSVSAVTFQLYQLLFTIPCGHDSISLDEAVLLLLTELQEQRRRVAPIAHSWISTIRDRLLDQPEAPPSLGELAQLISIHPAHLCRAFRAHFGITIGQFARRVRIDRAVQMISSTDTPLSAIALRFGYVDQAHFTRDFRQFTGVPPGRFRRMIRFKSNTQI